MYARSSSRQLRLPRLLCKGQGRDQEYFNFPRPHTVRDSELSPGRYLFTINCCFIHENYPAHRRHGVSARYLPCIRGSIPAAVTACTRCADREGRTALQFGFLFTAVLFQKTKETVPGDRRRSVHHLCTGDGICTACLKPRHRGCSS